MVAVGYGVPAPWLSKAGGTMTGDLALNDATPDTPLSAAPKTYVDSVAAGGGIPITIIDAKGDLIAGSAADTAVRVAVGANGRVLTADSSAGSGVSWQVPSGGGSAPIVRDGYVSDQGVVALANVGTTWTIITQLDNFLIPAVAGDRITFQPSFLAILAGTNFLDVAVVVGGLQVRYASTGNGTPAVQGDPTAYREAGDTNIRGLGPFTFVAQAGDISGGNVSFAMVYSGTGTTSNVQAGTNYPFRWIARNDGQ